MQVTQVFSICTLVVVGARSSFDLRLHRVTQELFIVVQQLAAPLARRPPSRGATPAAEARMPALADAALRAAKQAAGKQAAAAAAAAVARVSGGSDGGGFGAIRAGGGDADMADAADMLSSLQALSAAGSHGPGAPLGPPPPLGVGPPGFGALQPPFAPQACP